MRHHIVIPGRHFLFVRILPGFRIQSLSSTLTLTTTTIIIITTITTIFSLSTSLSTGFDRLKLSFFPLFPRLVVQCRTVYSPLLRLLRLLRLLLRSLLLCRLSLSLSISDIRRVRFRFSRLTSRFSPSLPLLGLLHLLHLHCQTRPLLLLLQAPHSTLLNQGFLDNTSPSFAALAFISLPYQAQFARNSCNSLTN
jgi:hypothetical protein